MTLRKEIEEIINNYLGEDYGDICEKELAGRICSLIKERLEKEFKKIPSDEQMLLAPSLDYANAYYQGKFDVLMDLQRELSKEG